MGIREPFPSEAYREEVKKHPWLQEGWEPKFGDWYIQDGEIYIHLSPVWTCKLEGDFWLPTLRQLIEMTEERGCAAVLDNTTEEWTAAIFTDGNLKGLGLGPDPETAVLRALAEVVEKKDG